MFFRTLSTQLDQWLAFITKFPRQYTSSHTINKNFQNFPPIHPVNPFDIYTSMHFSASQPFLTSSKPSPQTSWILMLTIYWVIQNHQSLQNLHRPNHDHHPWKSLSFLTVSIPLLTLSKLSLSYKKILNQSHPTKLSSPKSPQSSALTSLFRKEQQNLDFFFRISHWLILLTFSTFIWSPQKMVCEKWKFCFALTVHYRDIFPGLLS